MCRGLIGKKIGMTGIFSADGRLIPVTVIQAGPCFVTQIKTIADDGYNALQIGFCEQKQSRLNRPKRGHLQKSGGHSLRYLREVAVDDPTLYKLGQRILPDIFKVGEHVNVVGTTKGRGFAGVIKRHGFHGGKNTHGSHSHRIPGSIGCSAWPGKVIKGKKLPGHYGNSRKTVLNLEIVDIRPEENLIMIKGAVPGHTSALVAIQKVAYAA